MRVSIFGANGYIGQRLKKYLLTEGCHIHEFTSRDKTLFDGETGVIREQLLDRSIKTDAVVYLSQSPYYRKLPKEIEHVWGVNVISLVKAAEWAKSCGARRFIYASSGNVYFPGFKKHREEDDLRQDDWYALSKVQAEQVLSFYRNDFSVTNIRLFGVYGPDQKERLIPKLIDSIIHNRKIHIHRKIEASNEEKGLCISICYIDDVVDIIFKLIQIETPYALNVSSKQVVSIRDISNKIGEILGKEPEFMISDMTREFDLIADVSKLIKLTNPKFTDFETGMSEVMVKYLNS